MTKVFVIENKIYDSIKDIKLPDNVYNRVTKYKIENDYKNSFVAWFFLLKILKEDFNIDNPIMYENEYHKPYIEGIFFNISHSNNMVVIGISNNNIGIDIEMINTLKDLSSLKKKLFSNELLDDDSFIKKWTQIEAKFKYDGTGIVYSNLKDLKIDEENIKSFEIFDSYKNKYYFSIKTNEEIDIKFIHFNDNNLN